LFFFFSPSKFAKNHEDFLSNQISKIHIGKTHTKFCKCVLDVRAKSSVDAVRGELGSYSILYNILLNMIKFWLHLVKNNDQSSILADAPTNLNSESWVGCIKDIFKCLNLQFIYNNINTLKETYVLKKVKQNLKEKIQTIWKNKLFNDERKNIEHKNKLRTYRKFKNIFHLEPYLLYLNKEERHTRTKFRISSHRLEVERGHYFGLKFEKRICKLCNDHVEDEEHFMISCKKNLNTSELIILLL
jgi:hypothetical protein